ncbi:MAG: transcription factor TFIIIC subunit tfc4 [Alyxoria varia]|nr:MAG: transcription factor TFIIIC subunit tfc4 [Alyxoria varia]
MESRDNVSLNTQNLAPVDSRRDHPGPDSGLPVDSRRASETDAWGGDDSSDDDSISNESIAEESADDELEDEPIEGVPYIGPNDTWAAAQVLQTNQSFGQPRDPQSVAQDELMFEPIVRSKRGRKPKHGRGGYSNASEVPRRALGRDWERTLRSKNKFKKEVFGVGRRGGPGRRGTHATADPGNRFKDLQMSSTQAFFNGQLENAAELATQAIRANPDMFAPHSLLSQIYFEMGRKHDSLVTLWAGAHPRREADNWREVAQRTLEIRGDRSDETLSQVLYCWSRVLVLDSRDINARKQRLEIYLEQDRWLKACKEYGKILKITPKDLDCLHQHAELCAKLNKSRDAKDAFERAFARYQADDPSAAAGELSFFDLNVYLDMICNLREWEEGLKVLKQNSRWLCGRKDDKIWDDLGDDDREWDVEDHPRRVKVLGFKSGESGPEQYDLPLEIRAKMGIYRLRMPTRNVTEAFRHFGFFESDLDGYANEYPEVFRDIGDSLVEIEHYQEALRYYEPLIKHQLRLTAPVTRRMAKAYTQLKDYQSAIMHLTHLTTRDPHDVDSLLELAKVYDITGDDKLVKEQVDNIVRQGRGRLVKRSGLDPEKFKLSRELLTNKLSRKKSKRIHGDAASVSRMQQPRLQEQDMSSMHERLKELTDAQRGGDPAAMEEWASIATEMTEAFKRKKVKFRFENCMPNLDLAVPVNGPKTPVRDGGDPGTLWVDLSRWFHIFCELALVRAKLGNPEAFKPLRAMLKVHSPLGNQACMQHVRHVEMACALILNDEEHLCEVARWFIKHNPHASDAYHLFAILSRVYSSGPSEHFLSNIMIKFMVHRIKQQDYPHVPDSARDDFRYLEMERRAYEVPAGGATSGENQPPNDQEDVNNADGASSVLHHSHTIAPPDPNLLTIMSHVYHHHNSSPQALHYHLRAYAVAPYQATTCLSIAVTYIHVGTRRTAKDKHYHVLEGVAWLERYRKIRLKRDLKRKKGRNERSMVRMEVLYNEGRFWHLLGLGHLAVGCYERCLRVGEGAAHDHDEDGDVRMENEGFAEDDDDEQLSDVSLVEDDEEEEDGEDSPDANRTTNGQYINHTGNIRADENGSSTDDGKDLPASAITSFKRTVSYTLQQLLAMGGDVQGARRIGDKYLVF